MFHYHPGEISFNEQWWEAYQKVNELFAEAIDKILQDGDLVWVQDYHLMLLPSMLRKRTKKDIKIGWFLHTPFPSSEIYRYGKILAETVNISCQQAMTQEFPMFSSNRFHII